MKRLLLSAMLLAVAMPVVWADQEAEKAAIRQRHEEWMATWNQHDAKKLAAFWANDGDLIDPSGVVAQGRDAVQKYFEERFGANGSMSATTYSGTIDNIRFIGDDVAIVDVNATVAGMKGPDGQPSPMPKHHVTWVAKKEAGKWVAVAARPAVPMAAPNAPKPPAMPAPAPAPR